MVPKLNQNERFQLAWEITRSMDTFFRSKIIFKKNPNEDIYEDWKKWMMGSF